MKSLQKYFLKKQELQEIVNSVGGTAGAELASAGADTGVRVGNCFREEAQRAKQRRMSPAGNSASTSVLPQILSFLVLQVVLSVVPSQTPLHSHELVQLPPSNLFWGKKN